MASIDVNRGAKRAREARAALALDPVAPLPCVLSVVEGIGGMAVIVTGMPDDVAGACSRRPGGALLWVNGGQFKPRQRFTLAHELGHAWCEHDGRLDVDTLATIGGGTTDPLEIQANAFAAEFLVPRAGMEDVIDGEPTLEEVVIISAHYGVSAPMVVYRLKQLRLASDRRIAKLEREVEDGLHSQLFWHLRMKPLQDRLGAIRHLPYLSPALDGTHLAAALRGEAPADAQLARAIERLLA
jgi:Zn-dependent peptidase ImmA (M78 family)